MITKFVSSFPASDLFATTRSLSFVVTRPITQLRPRESEPQLIQHNAMVKALRFKGDKKVKKRKRAETEGDNAGEGSSSKVAKQQEGEEAEGWVDSESSG